MRKAMPKKMPKGMHMMDGMPMKNSDMPMMKAPKKRKGAKVKKGY